MNIENVVELKHRQGEDSTPWGPGMRLQQAREELRLSKADVARQLKLKLYFVDAIENDDYSKLPALTFVRGYLRSYARLVNIPGDEVIELFNQLGLAEKPTPVSRQVFYKKNESSHDYALRVTSFVVGGLLFILLFGWWYSERTSSHNEIHPTPLISTESVKPATPAKPLVPASSSQTRQPTESAAAAEGKVSVQLSSPATQDVTPPSED